jgi:hypothetical protein
MLEKCHVNIFAQPVGCPAGYNDQQGVSACWKNHKHVFLLSHPLPITQMSRTEKISYNFLFKDSYQRDRMSRKEPNLLEKSCVIVTFRTVRDTRRIFYTCTQSINALGWNHSDLFTKTLFIQFHEYTRI